MSYNAKNYNAQGGDLTVIGGTLEIKQGASVTGITTATIVDNVTSTDVDKALSASQGKVLKGLIDGLADNVAVNQADSVAEDVTGLVTDFNALLGKLKDAGLMVADAE